MGPTLLPTPLSPTRGLLFRRTFKKRLAPDVASSNGLEAIVTGARAGIRFRFPTSPTFPGLSPSKRCLPSGDTETVPLLAATSLKRLDFASASSLHRSATRFLALPVDLRSRSPQSTALASSFHLLHAQSQRPRGQSPPRRTSLRNS